MRIVIVAEYCRPWPGGISEHVYFEARGLAARGHSVTVLGGPGTDRVDYGPGVATRALSRAHIFASNGAASRLSWDASLLRMSRLLGDLGPDVLHVHAPLDPLLPWLSVLASPAPVVGTFHASFSPSALWHALYGAKMPWARLAMRKLACRIAVSEEARRSIARYQAEDFVIIPNGVDVERFVPQPAVNAPNLLFVGRPDARKGLPVLLDAFAQVKRARPNACLRLVGPIDATNVGAQPGVELVGRATPESMTDHFGDAMLVVAPSLGGESQGIVLLEAMASQRVVIASDIAGYRDVVTHGESGWLVPPNDASALASALLRLIEDAPLRDRLAKNARARSAVYAWSDIVPRIETCLRDAMG